MHLSVHDLPAVSFFSGGAQGRKFRVEQVGHVQIRWPIAITMHSTQPTTGYIKKQQVCQADGQMKMLGVKLEQDPTVQYTSARSVGRVLHIYLYQTVADNTKSLHCQADAAYAE